MRATSLKKERAEAAKLAVEAFRHHTIVEEAPGRWYFGKDHTRIYSARVINAPGCLIVYGDCGEVMFQPSAGDALGWFTGVVNRANYDLSYLAEKVPPELKDSIKEFQPDLVRNWLRSEMADCRQHKGDPYYDQRRKVLAEMVIEFRDYYADERISFPVYNWWYDKMVEHKYDCSEPPNFEGLTFQFMFKVEMLRIFTIKLAEWRRVAA